MKKFIVFFIVLFIPLFGYSQNTKENKKEDVTITINLSKIGRVVDTIAQGIVNEVELFKEEIDTNLSEERKTEIKQNTQKAKLTIKEAFKGIHDEFHRGFRQGLRGEKYDPNRD